MNLEQAALGFVGNSAPLRSKTTTLTTLGYAPTPENEAIFRRLITSESGCRFVTNFGGLLIRELHLDKAGDFHQGHRHQFDHVTMLHSGKVECEILGEKTLIYEAPAAISIAAEKWHKFTAMTDNVVYFCVFSNRNDQSQPFQDRQKAGAEMLIEDDELRKFMNLNGATRATCPESACAGCSKAQK